MKTPGRRLRRVLNGGTDESGSTTSRTNVDPKLLTDPVARMKARPAPSLANARLIRGPQDLAGSGGSFFHEDTRAAMQLVGVTTFSKIVKLTYEPQYQRD